MVVIRLLLLFSVVQVDRVHFNVAAVVRVGIFLLVLFYMLNSRTHLLELGVGSDVV